MNLPTNVLAVFVLCATAVANGEERKSHQPPLAKIVIEPSSASLTGGNATLTTTALNRKAGSFVGDYQLKVTPYFFKSEKGKLSIHVSDEMLRKLINGDAVNVSGKATTSGTAESRPITVRAIPLSSDRGSVTVAVLTENGKLVFNSSYRFLGK